MAEEYLNSEALAQLPEGVQEVLRYIIRKFRPIFLYLYPEGWDVLDTDTLYQGVIGVDGEDPSGEAHLALIKEVERHQAPISFEFMAKSLILARLNVRDRLLGAILDSIGNGGRLIYAKELSAFQFIMNVYRRQSEAAMVGDSTSPDEWINHAESFFSFAKKAHEKNYWDVAAFLYFMTAETALKGLLVFHGEIPQNFWHNIKGMTVQLLKYNEPSSLYQKGLEFLTVDNIHMRRYPQGDNAVNNTVLDNLQRAALHIANHCAIKIRGRGISGVSHLSGPGGKRKGPLDDFIVCPPSS